MSPIIWTKQIQFIPTDKTIVKVKRIIFAGSNVFRWPIFSTELHWQHNIFLISLMHQYQTLEKHISHLKRRWQVFHVKHVKEKDRFEIYVSFETIKLANKITYTPKNQLLIMAKTEISKTKWNVLKLNATAKRFYRNLCIILHLAICLQIYFDHSCSVI